MNFIGTLRSRIVAGLFVVLCCCLVQVRAFAAWIAFNDHAAGSGTHVNATRWNAFNIAGGAPGSSGLLKDIVSGAYLPGVTLTIQSNASGVAAAGTQASAAAGSPAYAAFNSFVDFQGTPNPSIELSGSGALTYVFSGLNPSNRYNFKGTAIRGNATYTDRWTLIEIQDALSFVSAHTAHALTSNEVPTLLPSQCAINTGYNNTSTSGDYANWDNIRPSANGTFSVVCRQYTGAVPGGSSGGSKGFGITGIRLEELSVGPTPISIVVQPRGTTAIEGQTTNFFVTISGSSPQYQWFWSNAPIANATNATLTFSNITRAQQGGYYVIITNSVSSVTSSVAILTVNRAPPPSYVLINLTNHVWKYDDSGPASGPPVVSGLTWRQRDYDDSFWKSGRGILAFEDSNAYVVARTNTILALSDANNARIASYYFRTHFTLTNPPSAISFVLSNIIDDGAIAYLNGMEVWRFNMPSGTINPSTLANAAATEGVFVSTNLSGSFLQQGDNVLAFEVHQSSLTSADIVFGNIGIVQLLPPTPIVITNQPQDVTVFEGSPFTLQVGVSGTLPVYQWFKDGNAIPGANTSTYSVPLAAASNSGVYLVTISNFEFSAMSEPVQVHVNSSIEGPTLLEANGETSWILTTLTFDRPLLASTATNTGNYKATNTFGEALTIFSITLTNGTNVVLQTSPRRADANYIVVVNNVEGLAANHPAVAANSSLPVRRRVQLFAVDDTWEFYDPYPPFDPLDPGPSWNALNYDTSMWGIGAGAFHWGNSVVSVPVNTTLSPSAALVSYFRFPFLSSVSPAGVRIEMRALVNDGAVFYLNGQEFFRTNLPIGAIDWNTAATATGALSMWDTPVVLEPNTFAGGSNVVAVELHQGVAYDEKAFALEMFGSIESLITGPVVVTGGPRDTTALEGSFVRLSANSVGAEWFQWQMGGTNIPGATNAALVFQNASPSLDGHQFRVLAGNQQNSVWSTNATLHVVNDREAPRLLAAFAASNSPSLIILTFSRALAPESALTISNYVVTNATGDAMVVTNVSLLNETNVILSLSQPIVGNYCVGVNHLRDTTTLGNFTEPGARATIGAVYNIPMNAAWKYLLINTNPAVQAAFAGFSYDDSAWSGPNNALLYVEDATLPGPKNTLLALTDASGNRYNTYYFRKAFWSAVAATNVTLHIRHIIDDGLILHLNGNEIYRFNMPVGAVTAGTQAPANTGDAVLLGPFDLPGCAILAGTNILAAEVHQNGATSADVVFGLEINGSVPSVSFNPATDARLKSFRWGDGAILSWNFDGILESASSVSGPWLPVDGGATPFFILTNAPTTFFRLRQ